MRITVLRAFLRGGARQEPGTELDVPDVQARELIHMGKAAATVAKTEAAGVMTTQTAGALVSGGVAPGPADQKPADPADAQPADPAPASKAGGKK